MRTMRTRLRNVAGPSACASSPTTSEQKVNQSGDSEPLSFPDDGENHGLCINRIWVDTHASLLHTDHGLHVSVRGVQDRDEPKRKRVEGTGKPTRSVVAKSGFRDNAATASHAKSELHNNCVGFVTYSDVFPLQTPLSHHSSVALHLWTETEPTKRKALRMRQTRKLSWMIASQTYRSLTSLTPKPTLPSICGASVRFSWS